MIKKAVDYFVFSGLTASLGFVAVVYMTRTISPQEFGIIGLFMAVLFVLPHIISFSTMNLVSINKVKMSQTSFIDFSRSYFTFAIINAFLIFSISLMGSIFYKEYILLFLLLPILAFVQYLSGFHNAELVQEGKSKRYGTYRLFISVFSLLLTVVLISYFELTWDGRLLALLFGELIVLLITLKFSFSTLRNFCFDFDYMKFKEYLLFGLPLMAGLGAGWLLNQVDKFIVLHFFSLRDVGIYTVAYSIGSIVNMINQAVTNAIVPTIYNHLEKKEGHKIIKKYNTYYSLIIMSIALLVGLSSYWYVPLFLGDEYHNSPSIILFISLAFAFNGIYKTTGGVIAFYKENKLQMLLLYISAMLNVFLSIVLIPMFGILAPAIGTIFAYIVLASLSYVYSWKILVKEENC